MSKPRLRTGLDAHSIPYLIITDHAYMQLLSVGGILPGRLCHHRNQRDRAASRADFRSPTERYNKLQGSGYTPPYFAVEKATEYLMSAHMSTCVVARGGEAVHAGCLRTRTERMVTKTGF